MSYLLRIPVGCCLLAVYVICIVSYLSSAIQFLSPTLLFANMTAVASKPYLCHMCIVAMSLSVVIEAIEEGGGCVRAHKGAVQLKCCLKRDAAATKSSACIRINKSILIRWRSIKIFIYYSLCSERQRNDATSWRLQLRRRCAMSMMRLCCFWSLRRESAAASSLLLLY